MTPSLNAAKDVDNVRLLCQDGNTLWSGPDRSYAHTVDLNDPAGARGILPLGNHEDPDHPELGFFFDNGLNDLWINGTVGGGTTPYMDAQDDLGLASPSNIAKVVRAPYPNNASYFGVDYSGWDPQRALSIELDDPTIDITGGTTVDIRISGIPELTDFELTGPELWYQIDLRADSGKVWQPHSTLPIVYHVNPSLTPVDTLTTDLKDIVLSYTVPTTLGAGDRVALQAVLTRVTNPTIPAGHPLTPDTEVSTMGMQLHIVAEE